jgi:hypothetical protein
MSTSTRLCSKCGGPLDESTRFCPKCGAVAEAAKPATLQHERHPVRWLAVGLILVMTGVLFLLPQKFVMSTQAWLAYFVAGLGIVLVISGLISSLGKYSQQPSAPVPQPGRTAEHPRKAKFSGQLGIEHGTLIGRKILLEFDPSTPYQTVVKDFAVECASNKEAIVILTPAGSVVEQAVSGNEDVKIINLTHDLMLSSILEDHLERPLNMVYDSLTDLALSADPRTAYRFTLNALRQLSDPKVTAVFLLNPSAHDPKDVNSLRGLFSNQFVYGKEGVSSVKFA